MNRWSVWRAVFDDARRQTNADLHIVTERFMTTSILFAIYVLLVWQFVGASEAGNEFETKCLAAVAPLLPYPAVYLFRLITTIPDREARLFSRIGILKDRLTPRFEIALNNEGRPATFVLPPTTRFVGGKPANSLDETADFICFTAKNISDRRSDIYSAQIIEMEADNGSRLTDPIELLWQGVGGGDQQWVTISAGATHTVKLFRVLDGRPAFNMSVGPVQYRDFFEGAARTKGLVVLDDRYYGSQAIQFCLELEPELRLSIVNIEPRARADVHDIEDDKP